jgi:hypothetical protein
MLSLALLLQNGADPAQIRQLAMAMMAIIPFIVILGMIVVLIPIWFICKKAGFSPWLSLLSIIPLGGVILLYVLAFADWKTSPLPQQVWQPPSPQPRVPPGFPPQA